MRSIKIRKILLEDMATIALLHEKTMPGFSVKLGRDYLTKFYRLLIDHPEIYHCLVAFKNKEIVGFISVSGDVKKSYQLEHSLLSAAIGWHLLKMLIGRKITLREIINRLRYERCLVKRLISSYFYIQVIFVNKKDQGQGIGRLLLRTVLDLAAKLEKKRVYVDTRADNLAAVKFYTSVGFAIKESAFDNLILEYQKTRQTVRLHDQLVEEI